MRMFLQIEFLIAFAAIPTVIVLVAQTIIIRLASKTWKCLIPFLILILIGAMLVVTCLFGGISNRLELYVMLYMFEALSCSIIADIIGWIIGLSWRGYHICKLREMRLKQEPVSLKKITDNIINDTVGVIE